MKHFLFLILLSSGIIHAQNDLPFPKRVTVNGIEPSVPSKDRNYDSDESNYFASYNDNFHPIGWSKDGKAAYLFWGEGEFNSQMGVIIYDAVNDSISASWFEYFDEVTDLPLKQVRFLWKRDKDSIQPLLERYKIITDTNVLYADLPFSYTDGNQKKNFKATHSLHVSPFDERFYDSISVVLEIRQGEKTDSVKINSGGHYDVNLQPDGIWMSPDRKFALLVIVFESGGQHGTLPPHDVGYIFKAIKLPE